MAFSGIELDKDKSNNNQDKDSKKGLDTKADKEEEGNKFLDMDNEGVKEDQLDNLTEEVDKIKFSMPE